MHIFSDFSEFKAAVGSEIGASEWIEVTQERISLFASASLRRPPATINGSISTRSGRKRNFRAA
jgi:hypothetical protein